MQAHSNLPASAGQLRDIHNCTHAACAERRVLKPRVVVCAGACGHCYAGLKIVPWDGYLKYYNLGQAKPGMVMQSLSALSSAQVPAVGAHFPACVSNPIQACAGCLDAHTASLSRALAMPPFCML
jgi:hypothetical protein